MHDPSRKNKEIIEENSSLKQRIKELEHSEEERKRAEKALQDSENRLREITTQIPGVVYQFYVKPNGAMGFYYVSSKSEQVIGLKPDLEGYFERFSAIVIPEHRDSFIKSIEKSVKEASEWKYEGMLQKPSGETIWFSGNSTPSLREDEIVFNGIVRDISNRKRAEKELQLSEERFRLLVKNSSDIMGIVDPDGKQRYVSDSAESITDFPASELASKNISEVIHPDDLLRISEAFQGCLAHPDRLLRAEYRHIHKTKGWVYVEAIGQNFIDDPNIRGVITNVRDITERKKADEALKHSEVTYREIFNTVNDAIWVHDIETGAFLDVNNAVTEIFGYSVSEALNLTVGDISSGVHPFTQETAMALFRAAVDGQPQYFEWQCKHKDGHLFWTEVNLKRVSIAGKECVLAIERDINERKQAEEALRKSEEYFREIIQNSSDLIFAVDNRGIITYESPSVERILGYSHGELRGTNVLDLFLPEDLPRAISDFQKALHTKDLPIPNSFRIRHKNGKVLLMEGIGKNLLHNPAIASFVANFRDVTDQKRAEEALRESEERFRSVVERSLIGIAIIDDAFQYTYVNEEFCNMAGYGKQEIIGKNFTFLLAEESKLLVAEINRRRQRGEDVPTQYEFSFVQKNGEKRIGEVRSSLYLDSANKTKVIIQVIDITERKRAEEENRTLTERLQHADKMEAIGTLAGGIAHDFNNLLMGIQGYASLALMNLDPSHPNYERLKGIEEQVQSGADLTRQLLGFARGGRYEVKPADMNEILEKSSSMFGRTKKEISIHRKFAKDLWSVEADRGQMEQVFMNLYVNAWQAMPGGGTIYLETEKIILDDEQALSYNVKPGQYVKITINDTGTGMDAKTRERIFDPFFTTKEMGRGTGLGLATVYGIIKGHGGIINVYSEPGCGTTFNIYLPASEKEMVKEKAATGTIARGTETILLVDDEKMILDVSKELLEAMGYLVYAAGSGQEAIAVFMEKGNDIDLVVLDMIMPGISGGETFDRLREIDPGVKVLLSSGYSITGQAQEILDRGCKGFLQKPFHPEILSNKIREMLA